LISRPQKQRCIMPASFWKKGCLHSLIAKPFWLNYIVQIHSQANQSVVDLEYVIANLTLYDLKFMDLDKDKCLYAFSINDMVIGNDVRVHWNTQDGYHPFEFFHTCL
jgi:hypothetical protein